MWVGLRVPSRGIGPGVGPPAAKLCGTEASESVEKGVLVEKQFIFDRESLPVNASHSS